MTPHDNPDRRRTGRRLFLLALLLLLFVIVMSVVMIIFYHPATRKEEPYTPPDLGTRRPEVNPFHHAQKGDWVMLETTPVLKTDKFVSSRRELEQYLVREVPAGTVLRIRVDHGRWKEVNILLPNQPAVQGWVDSEKAPGRQANTPDVNPRKE